MMCRKLNRMHPFNIARGIFKLITADFCSPWIMTLDSMFSTVHCLFLLTKVYNVGFQTYI